MPTVHCQTRAMAALFEIWLVGEDADHLRSIGGSALEETERLDALLSSFDPTSEVSRINRAAGNRPVFVDVELFEILRDCKQRFETTDGHFDALRRLDGGQGRGKFAEQVELDSGDRLVALRQRDVAVDLGGYAKGYAIDRAADVVRRFGVENALLHGGTSSALALGRREDGASWKVRLRRPFRESTATPSWAESVDSAELLEFSLEDEAFSTSADGSVCTVLATTALEAEVLSTALLAMGRARAGEFLGGPPHRAHSVAWIDTGGRGPCIDWLVSREATHHG